jgi:hypothetical protein
MSFDAKKEARGLLIYFLDENGKLRKQSYSYVRTGKGKPNPAAATPVSKPVGEPVAASPATPATASEKEALPEIKCNFSSMPPGAEITVDGRYVGSSRRYST